MDRQQSISFAVLAIILGLVVYFYMFGRCKSGSSAVKIERMFTKPKETLEGRTLTEKESEKASGQRVRYDFTGALNAASIGMKEPLRMYGIVCQNLSLDRVRVDWVQLDSVDLRGVPHTVAIKGRQGDDFDADYFGGPFNNSNYSLDQGMGNYPESVIWKSRLKRVNAAEWMSRVKCTKNACNGSFSMRGPEGARNIRGMERRYVGVSRD
jgi:hypothetical protein